MTLALIQSLRVAHRQALSCRRACRVTLPLTLLALLSIVPAARADVGATIIERCTHGQSLSGFSQQDYRRALQELPAEVEEYSDCANLIRRAQLAGARGGGSEAVSLIPSTPAERSALRHASRAGGGQLIVGGQLVQPGVIHASVSSALSMLPSPLLALLAFLLAGALALAGKSITDRVRARRSN
jgi:hypothetical protein